MSQRKQTSKDAVAESAARLFTEERLSYSQIAKRLNLPKKTVKAKVWAGLRQTPQMVHQERKVQS